MRDILPDRLFRRLERQFERGADAAVQFFDDASGDEDTITGTLVQSIGSAVRGSATVDGARWTWSTRVRKLRGRGPGAHEKEYGADAVIEIEVRGANNEIVARKLVPVQAKKNWSGTDRDLAEQCRKMLKLPGGALAVDYSKVGYVAVAASAVVEARGNRNLIPSQEQRSFGKALGEQFLACTVGSRELYFDVDRGLMLVPSPGGLEARAFAAQHRVRTIVRKR